MHKHENHQEYYWIKLKGNYTVNMPLFYSLAFTSNCHTGTFRWAALVTQEPHDTVYSSWNVVSPSLTLRQKKNFHSLVSMETPHRSTFWAIYGSLDGAVNLMKECHSESSRRPVLGEAAALWGPGWVVNWPSPQRNKYTFCEGHLFLLSWSETDEEIGSAPMSCALYIRLKLGTHSLIMCGNWGKQLTTPVIIL